MKMFVFISRHISISVACTSAACTKHIWHLAGMGAYTDLRSDRDVFIIHANFSRAGYILFQLHFPHITIHASFSAFGIRWCFHRNTFEFVKWQSQCGIRYGRLPQRHHWNDSTKTVLRRLAPCKRSTAATNPLSSYICWCPSPSPFRIQPILQIYINTMPTDTDVACVYPLYYCLLLFIIVIRVPIAHQRLTNLHAFLSPRTA